MSTVDEYIKNRHFVDGYEKFTGEKATYRRDSSDYHTLRYIVWVHNKLQTLEAENKALRDGLNELISQKHRDECGDVIVDSEDIKQLLKENG